MTEPNLPTDVQDMINLREYVEELRTVKGFVVDPLPEPPMHVPGCDDPKGKFKWWVIIDKEGQKSYFHTKHGVEL